MQDWVLRIPNASSMATMSTRDSKALKRQALVCPMDGMVMVVSFE